MTRILIFAFGSRGDVQPLVALGKGLQRAGHEVTLAAGSNFEAWIEREGLGYARINVDIEASMQTELGKEWLGNSSSNPLQELRNMREMTRAHGEQIADDVMCMADDADVYISGLLTVEPTETLAQVRGKRHIAALLSPVAPTRSGAAGMQAFIPGDSIINRWWGYAIEAMLSSVLKPPSDALRKRLGQPPARRAEFMRAMNRTPALLGVSSRVIPPPRDWGDHIHITGYWFLDAASDWQPSTALEAFLAAGDPPVYLGFGSMASRDPAGTARVMLDALRAVGKRGIIHSGWAGLHADELPPEVFLLDYAPHDWLFPRMAGVVHHGGAGTTAAALRAGVPSTIVAHMGDQPYWGRRVRALGVGAAPMQRYKMTAERLASAIRTMTTDRAMQARAAALGEQIRAEDGVANAVELVGRYTS